MEPYTVIQEGVIAPMAFACDQGRIRMLLDLTRKLNDAFMHSNDLDEILQAVLVGVTAGEGLGFNRAFLVRVDTQHQDLRGAYALGPATREEASRIWSDIDRHGLSIFQILEGVKGIVRDSGHPLNQLAVRIRVPLAETDHLLVRSLRDRRAFLIGGPAPDGPEPPADLVGLLGTNHFAIAPLASAREAYGVILADNLITGHPILTEDVEALHLFAGIASFGVCKANMCRILEDQVREMRRLNEEVERNKSFLVEAERYTALGQMADLLLHEIRNPLSAVGGVARLLYRKSHEPELQQYAEVIAEESRRLEQILEALFDFSQAPKLDLQPARLYQLIEAPLALLQSEFTRQNIVLHTDLKGPGPVLNLDRTHIQQALLNIFKNAVDAMPEGGCLTITVRTEAECVEISVTDTGLGMVRAHASKALEPFFTTKAHGMGLGLSLAKRIFELHGGRLYLSCDCAGRGITVHLTLPAVATSTGP